MWRENTYAVQVHNDANIQKIREHLINKVMKNGWGITQAKRHHKILIMSISGVKGCLSLITLSDPNQIVSSTEV